MGGVQRTNHRKGNFEPDRAERPVRPGGLWVYQGAAAETTQRKLQAAATADQRFQLRRRRRWPGRIPLRMRRHRAEDV